jgi:anti-sigma regulatory factor (Ser/Thr protein kinase)
MRSVERALNRSYPAVPASIPPARSAVAELAIAAGAAPGKVHAVRLAVSEALTNVVRHAYPDDPGQLHLTAALAGGELWVLVADDGAGLTGTSKNPGLGLGLALIAQEADDFTVGPRSTRGVELRMRFDLQPERAGETAGVHSRGSLSAASTPASPTFSTTT